ncbi:SCO2525 family SAM-dependent methyltransferase [Kitasatospora cinereorecta]|uniref:SCO2525 family SAM-dependent methyltransferase n=1 Tax=Kitasatospora cinereorecta TaxID=285560 RepID=A0ABW0V4H7_9ACTN
MPFSPARTNSEAPWDLFDSVAYHNHNYSSLRSDDRQILAAVRDHFLAALASTDPASLRGIDVGAGTNLYPSLAMLPWCREITLFERSERNVAWLRNEVVRYGDNWDEFWAVLCEREETYPEVADPRARLAGVADVRQGDLFDGLPGTGYDLGTMFFVAESLTTAHEEFETAVDVFARALGPGAPFAVAFMENSLGYEVGELSFPACRIDSTDVVASLAGYAAPGLRVERIEVPGEPLLREGYTGMLLALGRRGGERTTD